MIRITNLDNLMGIVIHGDYDDLQQLHQTLWRMDELYYKNRTDLYSHSKSKQSKKQSDFAYSEYEYYLSLNYDIRKAFSGDRFYEIRDNHSNFIEGHLSWLHDEETDAAEKYRKLHSICKYGNLQYSVAFLYPLALYYLFMTGDFLGDFFEDSVMDNLTVNCKKKFRNYPKKQSVLYQDLGILLDFYGKLLNALEESVGENKTDHLMKYMNENIHIANDWTYCDALSHYFWNHGFTQSENVKKSMILNMAYEMYDYGMVNKAHSRSAAAKDYKSAMTLINKSSEVSFPVADVFYTKLQNYENEHENGQIYRDDFEGFLDQEFGVSDDDLDIFETSPWPEGF